MKSANATLFALVTSVFGYALMRTMVVPAVGLLQRELDTTPGGASWIIGGFLLSSAVLTPLLGRMGDLYGKRRVLLAVARDDAARAADVRVLADLRDRRRGRAVLLGDLGPARQDRRGRRARQHRPHGRRRRGQRPGRPPY
ncbi:hypothetical protein GCM10009733_023480 [Nonomuraea maheshkhaliensis]|uniref:MFS transporter n=1 Tax=Nonomuraea maheshkhaliensis TaxID=419590 RepID=A0ABN2F1M4_9ACTN